MGVRLHSRRHKALLVPIKEGAYPDEYTEVIEMNFSSVYEAGLLDKRRL